MGDFFDEIKISDTPFYDTDETPVNTGDKKYECGNCGSDNTTVLYREGEGCIIGYSIETECKCNDCGKYTLHIFNYES